MNKSNFRILGIGFLIASILYLIFSDLSKMATLFFMWIFDPVDTTPVITNLLGEIFRQTIYTQLIVFLFPLIIELFIFIWSLVLAIMLIKNKKYTPQIKYFFYFLFIQYLVFFILLLPIQYYINAITNLITAIAIYFIVIWKKGWLSKFLYP